MTDDSQQHSTWLAARSAALSAHDLWPHYYSSGGTLKAFELDAYLHGLYPLPVSERNTVALALNELIDDLPQRPRAQYTPVELPEGLGQDVIDRLPG